MEYLLDLTKQGTTLIPYDIMILVAIFIIFGIVYFRLLESLRAKKEIITRNITRKTNQGILLYSNLGGMISDALDRSRRQKEEITSGIKGTF
jgi:hypothetical protein